MNSNDDVPAQAASMRGTPRDYSTDMYRVYFEVGEHDGLARRTIEDYLGTERSKTLISLPYGYECEVTIQIVPEIVAVLLKHNIGVYQVVRYAKTNSTWT